MNLATFLKLLLNFCDLTTLTCILGHVNLTTLFAPPSPACAIIACGTASCFCCCQTTCFKLMSCQIMVYGGSNVVGDNGSGNSDAGDDDWLSESTNSILDSLPDSYSDSNVFLCKS